MTKKILLGGAMILLVLSTAFPQKRARTAPAPKPKPIVFAVLNDGQTLEPIGELDKGELVAVGEKEMSPAAFVAAYYKPRAVYNLIFGGASAGTVTVKSSNAKAECAKNLAQATTVSTRAKIKGLVMGLASSVKPSSSGSGVRRMPTFPEREEIESLVRAEFVKQGVGEAAARAMKYHNLTALDVDSDGKAEMVGTFWAENSEKERNLLFFIAEKDAAGKYSFGFSEYKKITPDDVMSGELKDIDEMGGELLLDVLEYTGDKSAEIFTIDKAFEGNNFHVYSRREGKWTRVFEGYNYHCAY